MDFQTKVELPTGSPLISHSERILLMGSCFAENIGSLLAENKFRVDMNPFGILYNPLSVSAALVERYIRRKIYSCIRSAGIVRCIMVHFPRHLRREFFKR